MQLKRKAEIHVATRQEPRVYDTNSRRVLCSPPNLKMRADYTASIREKSRFYTRNSRGDLSHQLKLER